MKTHSITALAAFLLAPLAALRAETPARLTQHIQGSADLADPHDLRAEWDDGILKLATEKAERYAWVVIPPPKGGWKLDRCATIDAEISNTGSEPAGVMFWVVGEHGWSAVVDAASLAPSETRTFSCNLRATYPDGTPKLNPSDIKQVQIMLSTPVIRRAKSGSADPEKTAFNPLIVKPLSIEVRHILSKGDAPEWKRPPDRLDVPAVEESAPSPGKRVRYRLADDSKTNIYCVLNLPEDWRPGAKFPVIVEYPGNILFGPECYSSGMPDQCVIGYGITKGKGAICLGMPFLDRATQKIASNAWGNPGDTADYVVKMVDEICSKFGGDRENILLTGFSRGAIACGFIGLRDDHIASYWKGFHACQHSDGSNWNGATMDTAITRAARFRGKAVFQTDNSPEKFQPVMDAMHTKVTWANSGLGFHSTAMFLDERPSTQQLREWFWELVKN